MAAADEYEPSLISRYLINLAQQFNWFYHDCPVLVEGKQQEARLVLVYAKTTLAVGLGTRN